MARYIAFDVETPNIYHNRICQLGLCVWEDGRIRETRSWLINPETSYSYANIRIHGITEYDTMTSPSFPEVWPAVSAYLRSGIVAAHNAAFDLRVLRATLLSYEMEEAPLPCLCTLRLARRYVHDTENHKLDTLCRHFHLPLQHHDAGSDSRACALLLDVLLRQGADPAPFVKSYPLA